ncbi:MAG TPA: DegT/DnrJ/EryC1/StrS family aminotransferase [Bryobacteraceae bacterium]|nr:DegT/DnrJ/EryC1/StrS family aminotransferase [Bryobacteraceae bacterium]
MPTAVEILPYLETIDAHRWYSNWGPLVTRLEEQLARRLSVPSESVVTAANCTAGLTAALLAREVPAGSFCIMPSWTFAATPHAARGAGLIPWFHDVDPATWALNPDTVADSVKQMHPRPGAVIAVSPFGAPIDIQAWEAFEAHTGIPVIVDAAAGFDTVRASKIPCVVSLHATKILGAGEGGFISTTDAGLADRLRACCNFGFRDSRSAMAPAMNAKMSEYHAAVALASLAAWPSTRAQHTRISERYAAALAPLAEVTPQPGYGIGWVSATTSVLLPPGSALSISERLNHTGIESRSWWGAGCHLQPAFADCPREVLATTEDLGSRVLGLPHFLDLRPSDVDRVVQALSETLRAWSLRNLSERISETRHYLVGTPEPEPCSK